MSGISVSKARSVLISGASVAGPTLAYWLDRYGFDVTVVERASSIRVGGYPIDIRGTAIEVISWMGLLPQVEAAHIASRAMTFVDGEGRTIGTIPIYDLTGNEAGQDVELPRGTLTTLLYGLTSNSRVRYRFADSIEALEDDGAGVDVSFKGGDRQRYDVVIGADGLHSNTRRLAFGPETPFNHHLGASFNLFAQRYTERHLFGWEVPAGVLQAVNPLFIIIFAPIFAVLWLFLGRHNRDLSAPAKFGMGLIFLGLGFLIMYVAAGFVLAGQKVAMTWLVFTYMMHTWGELCLSPVGLSSMTKLVPTRFVGQVLGVWFMATALGTNLAGRL